MRDLARRLGAPHLGRVTVHVTGTKGKGSVAAMTAAGLRAAGFRVGVYTSPHVERLNERVLVPGLDGGAPAPIADDAFAAALERVLDVHDAALAEGGEAAARTSWFDLVSLAAFTAFRAAGLDAQVIEVGLGGRLDSTNIVAPDVCVVTNVELEHTAILGTTRAAIAAEKAGILKPGVPIVSGMPPGDEAGDVVLARARELRASSGPAVPGPAVPGQDVPEQEELEQSDVHTQSVVPLSNDVPLRIEPPRPGDSLFTRNLRHARAALDLLGARGIAGAGGAAVHGGLLTEALAHAAALPGRMELRWAGEVPVLFDGAHVPASLAQVVAEALADPRLGGTPITLVAVHHEKDVARLLAPLARLCGRVFCTTLPTGVHRSAEDVAEVAVATGLQAEAVSDPFAAFDAALAWLHASTLGHGSASLHGAASLERRGWVLVTGSLYLVGALRARTSLGREQPPNPQAALGSGR